MICREKTYRKYNKYLILNSSEAKDECARGECISGTAAGTYGPAHIIDGSWRWTSTDMFPETTYTALLPAFLLGKKHNSLRHSLSMYAVSNLITSVHIVLWLQRSIKWTKQRFVPVTLMCSRLEVDVFSIDLFLHETVFETKQSECRSDWALLEGFGRS